MRWSVPVLLGVAVALWVDALRGGSLAGNAVSLLVVAGCALVAGLGAAWPGVVLAGVATSVLLAVADQVADPGRFSPANDGVFYVVVVLGPGVVGLAVAARGRQVALLEERRRALESRRRTVVLAARAEEAERVTRQVDAALADSLGVIVASATDPTRFALLEDTARRALGELREVLGVLHEPAPAPVHAPAPTADRALGRDRLDAVLLLAGVPLAVETAHAGPVVLDVIASLAQGALLPVVRRRPVVGATALLAVAIAQTAYLAPLPPTVSWLLPGLLLAALVGATPGRRRSLAGLGVTLVGLGVLTLATPAGHRSGGLVPGLLLGLLAWSAGRVLAHREARARELRAIADELARTESAASALAVSEQRAELARELHDVGAHALTVACLQAGAARTWADRDPERARLAAAALRELAVGPLTAFGDSLTGLSRGPQGAALLEVVTGFGRVLGLEVDTVVLGRPRALPDDVAAAAARVVQEALTNAARHARGSGVVVEVRYDADALQVRVRDSGPRVAEPADVGAGLGLRGMRERVAAVRGELVAGPAGRGFEVLATLPG